MSIYVKESTSSQQICRNTEEELISLRKDVDEIKTSLNMNLNDDWYVKINDYLYVRRKNSIVSILGQSLGTKQIEPNKYVIIGTVPEKCRPMNQLSFYVNPFEKLNISMFGTIAMNGEVSIYTTAANNYWRYDFTYQVY